jgi:hypothetical protein
MASMNSEPQYEVLWPLAEKADNAREPAPRLADLAGKTVAELWDAKFHGETIFPLLRERMGALFPGIRFVEYGEFGNFYGPREKEILGALPEKLRRLKCDAVITGIGA